MGPNALPSQWLLLKSRNDVEVSVEHFLAADPSAVPADVVSVAGISTLMGPPRFAIIVCPTSRNVPGVMDATDRLRLNHVPQNTPATA
jgi:hypothetical protein